MEIEQPVEKTQEDSSEEEDNTPNLTQVLDLKLDIVESSAEKLKSKDHLWIADKIFFAFWGTPSIFLQSIANTLIREGKAFQVARLNFEKARQNSLANIYYVDSVAEESTFFIIFNEKIAETKEYKFQEFLSKTFIWNPSTLEFVIFDSSSKVWLRNPKDVDKIRFLSTNYHSKSTFEELKHCALPLEVGNHYESHGADILVFSEFNNLKANLFLGINDELGLNSEDVKKFGQVAGRYPALKVSVDLKEVSQLVSKNKDKVVASSNIYL